MAEVSNRTTAAPLVTIGIPTFNRSSVLGRAVRSALDQDYPDLEVVVCDNASSDDTETLARQLAAQDRRVKYVRHAENLGAVRNFLAALYWASGDYFMWLADDDWIEPSYVSTCVAVLQSAPDCVLAAGRSEYFAEGAPPHWEPVVELTRSSPAARVLWYCRTVAHNGVFYGISPTQARRMAPIPDTLGGDWIHVAGLASIGTVRAAPTTIHRAAHGTSFNLRLGFKHYTLPIASGVARHVATSASFSALPRIQRLPLAAACGGVLWWRISWWSLGPRLSRRAAALLRSVLPDRQYRRLRAVYPAVLGRSRLVVRRRR